MIQEIKYGGYSAKPSDYISPDGELAQVGNLVPEDGELHPVFPPSQLLDLNGWQVLFSHNTPDYDHYIVLKNGGLAWCDDTVTELDDTATDPDTPPTPISGFPGNVTINKVTAIGNTLVVLTSGGVEYVLWKGNGYTYLGQQPPQVYFSFGLDSELVCYPDRGANPTMFNGNVNGDNVPLPTWSGSEAGSYVPPRERIEGDQRPDTVCNVSLKDIAGDSDGGGEKAATVNLITNWALGAVNTLVNRETQKGRFTQPFFIRYAYELYDGSTIMHSYPVLLVPNSRAPILGLNSATTIAHGGLSLKANNNERIAFRLRGRSYAFASSITFSYTVAGNLDNWADIVRAINIYITPPVYTYDQDAQVYGWKEPETGFWDTFYTIARMSISHGWPSDDDDTPPHQAYMFRDAFVNDTDNMQQTNGTYGGLVPESANSHLNGAMFAGFEAHEPDHPGGFKLPSYLMDIPERSSTKMQDLLANESRFYKIASFAVDEMWDSESGTLSIQDGVLSSLAARPVLTDDYHSRDHLNPSTAFIFNGRLSLGNVLRTRHIPLPAATAWTRYDYDQSGNPVQWLIGVNINDAGTTRYIYGAPTDTLRQNAINFPLYLFYPDASATSTLLTRNTTLRYFKAKLVEHAFLNGAYWLDDIRHPMCLRNDLWGSTAPGSLAHDVVCVPGNFPVTPTATPINEQAKVYTSDVNNPFRFPVTGINTVGTGKILALCATTKPLSQGQFGQFPLYVFTNEGIWALESASDGTFATRHPVTRDICNNPESITQLDDSIVFATEQGIMQLVGGNTECISRQLHDITGDWQEFLDGCRITYDYINQRIILYHQPVTTTSGKTKYYPNYVLSLRDKEWGMMDGAFVYNINAYPYALVVNSDGKLMDISHPVVQTVTASLRTRPLKLNLPNVLKTVDTVIQRGMFDFNDATRDTKPVQSILEGSRDLYNWYTIASSTDHYLRFSSGTPYKFFRITLILKLKPGESVYGCTVQFTPRLTNQPR